MEKSLFNSTLKFGFQTNKNSDRMQLLIELLKKNSLPHFHATITTDDLRFEDPQKRNILFYSCYYDRPLLTLYLIMRGLDPKKLDADNKSLFHICAYMGSLGSADLILTYQRHLRDKGLYTAFKGLLHKYGLKRTDLKNGELSEAAATPSKKNQFVNFQKDLAAAVSKYYQEELTDYTNALTVESDAEKKTPVHLVSLNKYQKCQQTLRLLFKEDALSDFNSNFLSHWSQCSSILGIQADPRIYNTIEKDAANGLSKSELEVILKKHNNDMRKMFKKVVSSLDRHGSTPLHIASYKGFGSIVQFLIKKGAVPEQIDNSAKGQQKIIQLATTNSVRKHIKDLCEASETGDKSSMTLLLNCGQEVNQKSTIFGTTPLIKSVLYGSLNKNTEATNILIQSGADLDIQDSNGWTPLHKACEMGNTELVQLILDKKGSVNKASNKGFVPLHIAALNDRHQIISLLVDCVKDINLEVKDNDGCTPLLLAAKKGYHKSVETLLKRKANLYAVDNKQWSSLHYSTFNEHKSTITLLLKYDADRDQLRGMKNCQGKLPKEMSSATPIRNSFSNIWRCAFEGKLDEVRKIVMEHFDKDERTIEKQRTPLMYAIMGGRFLVVKYLLEQGADTYAQDADGKTAQNYANELMKSAKASKDKALKGEAQKIVDLLNK